MFYRLFILYLTLPHYLPSYRHGKFALGRRARSPPTRRMKAVGDDVQFGTPAKKRSRRISTINRGVTERMCLITTNTYLRTLSIAVAPKSPKVTVGNLVTSQECLYVALGTSILSQVPYYLTVGKALVCVRLPPW